MSLHFQTLPILPSVIYVDPYFIMEAIRESKHFEDVLKTHMKKKSLVWKCHKNLNKKKNCQVYPVTRGQKLMLH